MIELEFQTTNSMTKRQTLYYNMNFIYIYIDDEYL